MNPTPQPPFHLAHYPSIQGNFPDHYSIRTDSVVSHSPPTLAASIAEYEATHEELANIPEDGYEEQTADLQQDEMLYATVKNEKLPVRMFKDRMELLKENREKKEYVSELERKNQGLKQEYSLCLMSNQKIEQFLKEIEFTFKNDSSNQKASDTLLRAKKNLHREQKESEVHIERLMKKSKVNEIRQLKMYLKVLREEKKRLQAILQAAQVENHILRAREDFNEVQRAQFESSQKLVAKILNHALREATATREKDEQERSTIEICLNQKKIENHKRQCQAIDNQIRQEVLRQEGLEYEIEVIKSKLQEKNKRHAREEDEILRKEIQAKKQRILSLKQEKREKIKTEEYITKWTKELRVKLQKLNEDHIRVKERFEEEINKLSREIEDWNRKYKAELVEEQFINRKTTVKESEKLTESSTQERKIRVVKIEEINHLRKKLIFYSLSLGVNCYEFIRNHILIQKDPFISLAAIYERLNSLVVLKAEPADDVFKLARYIVEQNNDSFSKIDMNRKIPVKLARLIVKNLVTISLTVSNFGEYQQKYREFLNKNFDTLKNDIWVCSGKTKNFTEETMKLALSKHIKEESTIAIFVELTEFLIWREFKSILFFQLIEFEVMCEKLLGRKLIKDNKRLNSLSIKEVFDSKYENRANQ